MPSNGKRHRAVAMALLTLSLGWLVAWVLLGPEDDEARATRGPLLERAAGRSPASDVAPGMASVVALEPASGAVVLGGADVTGGESVGGASGAVVTSSVGARTAGTLRGRVVGADGQPVPGAVAIATLRRRRGAGEPARAETDALGRFELVLPAGAVWNVRGAATDHVARDVEPVEVQEGAVVDVGTLRLVRARSRLVGRVLGPGDQPLAGARVLVWERDRREARTDASGVFSIDGLPEGVYRVSARMQRHVAAVTETVPVTEAQGGEVTLRLALGGRLEGRVRGPDGSPVPGAGVFVYRDGDRLAEAQTDAEGRYEVDGLPAGSVELFARTGDYGLSIRAEVSVVAGGLVVTDLVLAEGRRIVGRVIDSAGAAVSDAPVLAVAVGGDVRRSGRTDADGRFAVTDLYPGRYRLIVGRRPRGPERASAEVDVSASHEITCDLVVRDEAVLAGAVSGHTGQPVPRARVFAIRDGEYAGVAETDEQGGFRIDGLEAGEYRVFARTDGDALVGQLDVVAPREGLRLKLHAPAVARGRVLDPAGRPVAGLELRLRGLDGPVWREARTDADGRFELAPLYDGAYELEAAPEPLLLVAHRLDAARVTLAARQLTVTQGRDLQLELRLAVTN